MRHKVDLEQVRIPDGAKSLIKLLKKNKYEAYLVGGCVRDILMGRDPKDYDICTSAHPHETLKLLEASDIIYMTIGIAFGTVVAHMSDGDYEITTYRMDVATNGRHRPQEVQFSMSLDLDLQRRDFTINAMALDIYTGELIDNFGGLDDIQNKIIRSVGSPELRMQEDSLRILRALRFAITLEYSIEENTFQAMLRMKNLLVLISKERITQELRKIFEANKPVRQMFLKASDIVTQIIPEMSRCVGFDQNNKYHIHDVYEHILYVVDYCDTTDFEIKMAALLHDIAKPAAYVEDEQGQGHFYGHPKLSAELADHVLFNDFSLTSLETEHILALIEQHDNDIAETPKSVKKLLNKLGPEIMEKWFILKEADRMDHIYPDHRHDMDMPKLREIFNKILQDKQCFKLNDLKISGNDIMDVTHIKPSVQVGIILRQLLEEVISEEIPNEPEVLQDRAKQIHQELEEGHHEE